ncbi:MAG: hypothetical protein IPH06_13550 [Alphaproteobacteria bacterium]|nr:hypothetical protein [Alphaproteobacteria bacterium]QQS56476.1 MAG: hypothetical protein IPN28_09300 [Alphaproteobacteria bacterium]
MKDNHARLIGETEPVLDDLERFLEVLDGHALVFGRVEREGVEIFLALRALRERVGFFERAAHGARQKAPDLMNGDMLVLLSVEQMFGHLPPAAALVAFEDHGAPSFPLSPEG